MIQEIEEAIENQICIVCFKRANVFRNEKFMREYDKTGYCQECQDLFLGE